MGGGHLAHAGKKLMHAGMPAGYGANWQKSGSLLEVPFSQGVAAVLAATGLGVVFMYANSTFLATKRPISLTPEFKAEAAKLAGIAVSSTTEHPKGRERSAQPAACTNECGHSSSRHN